MEVNTSICRVDDHIAMTELYRMLKPDGWAILQQAMLITNNRQGRQQ